ncbi:chromosome segregation protein SMC [candidate division KSB1 bacterium]|nr:chromosome segregation protein SMC [candidate division KSB1 bacterium]
MQLVSLSISGFKSFARPTTLTFAAGITAIVGPNGCGKSNVVDALRWVMGEQRTSVLRGDRMENVIFNGTVNRKATGIAEVKIVLNNENGFLSSPFTEVEIARRLYRDGTSEYLLNSHECRLKDVTDLLHDSGMGPNLYTILELKMVEEILREDGEGRRSMFEEAAGVAKYKIRRRQAQAKLKQTDEDLLRLADILTEVERHVGSLKRQAIRARKYAELAGQLKSLETANLWHSYQRLVTDVTPLEHAVRDSTALSDSVKAALRLEEARLIEYRTAEIEADKEASARRSDLAAVVQDISRIESDAAALRAREQSCQELIERSDRERILLDQKRELVVLRQQEQAGQSERQETERQRAETLVQTVDAEFDVAAAQLRDVEAQARSHQEYVSGLRHKLSEIQRAYAQASAHHAALVSRGEMLRRDGMTILEQRAALGIQLEAAEADGAKSESEVEQAQARVRALEAERSRHQQELAELEERVRNQNSMLDATSSKLDLLSTLADKGPRAEARIRVLRDRQIAGVVNLLGDTVEVAEPYRRAFQAVLGPAAYYHLTGSAEAALRAADVLRLEQAGQGTFISLAEFTRSEEQLIDPPAGAIGTALSLLNGGVESAVLRHYLGRVVIVEHWEHALHLSDWARAHRATVVALDGQWISGLGIYHLGSEESRTPVDIGLAPQVRELTEQLDRQRAELDASRALLRTMRAGLAELEQGILGAKRTLVDLESARAGVREHKVKTETLLSSLAEREVAIEARLRELDAETAHATSQESEFTVAVQAAEASVTTGESSGGDVSLRLATAQQNLTATRERKHEAERRRDAARHQVELTRAEITRIEQTLDEIGESLVQATANRAQGESDLVGIRARLQEIDGQLLAKWKQRDHWTAVIDTASARVEELRGRTSAQEERLRTLRQTHDAELEGERKIELEIARLRGELDALLSSASSLHGLDLTAPDFVEQHPEVTAESTGEQVQELRERIERLGPVNLMAIEEFETENTRLDSMLVQREDLLKAKRTIEETIQRINETAQAQFLHTFEAVRAHFQRLFQEFFPAGEADLVLSGQDLLDADITLWANPSGKRLKSLSLMSGGEKTMTAIALLFALYQVKPSPFCVFDEVDAPLDDANIDRFNRVIRMHAETTQFILITHNRRTMEIADNLYGVTMEEEGVSKLVSVRLLPSAVAS